MKNKIKRILLTTVVLALMFLNGYKAEATTLPDNVVNTIKTELPDSSIRFDALITLKDGTVYLPVIPSNPDKTAKGKVVFTFPSAKRLAQKPDIVLFDSNYALLKVIKTKDGKNTISDPKNIPFIIKTGVFPQDMLVPPGLIIPEELKIVLGNLEIATENSRVNEIFKTPTVVQKGYITSSFTPIPEMKKKTLLFSSINSRLINIVASDSVTPLYTLEMENLPKFVQPVCNDNFILIAAAGKTYIDVADVNQEVIVKKIDLAYHPNEIILNSDKTKAFVSTSDEQAIFVINLKNMSLLEKIKVKGYPRNIAISPNDEEIVYQDKNSGDIYRLALDETYKNNFVYNMSNIAKLITKDNHIYVLSRSKSNLQVINTKTRELIYKQPVSPKPVDMLVYNNNLVVLSSSGDVSIFNLDDFSFVVANKLTELGFVRKIVRVNDTNIALITNITEKKYYVYDLNTNKVLQTVDTPVYVNDLQILNKDL